ncbi:MAG: hypothetical protein AAFN59_11365, partial [Pseudomonadota bacterium]
FGRIRMPQQVSQACEMLTRLASLTQKNGKLAASISLTKDFSNPLSTHSFFPMRERVANSLGNYEITILTETDEGLREIPRTDIREARLGMPVDDWLLIELFAQGEITVDFEGLYLMESYNSLIDNFYFIQEQSVALNKEFQLLREEWDEIADRRRLFSVRIASLFVLATVFPLRIGKSINDIRRG